MPIPKSQRLIELMLTVNRKRKFTVKELAEQVGVSTRTILRDLQELSELGVPLYSEVGPHGGYQVLNTRMLPPIAFSEQEAAAVFFAVQALRHYSSLPFKTESSAVLAKFYPIMPEDMKNSVDQMKNRVDFIVPKRQAEAPFLAEVLEAAIRQKTLLIDYASPKGATRRDIQPIGIYARNGLWYCPAYAFDSGKIRIFRCDRMLAVNESAAEPVDLQNTHLGNRYNRAKAAEIPSAGQLRLKAELNPAGVERCEAEPWSESLLHIREDGSGWLDGLVPETDLDFWAEYFIGLGGRAQVAEPLQLLNTIRKQLQELMSRYAIPADQSNVKLD